MKSGKRWDYTSFSGPEINRVGITENVPLAWQFRDELGTLFAFQSFGKSCMELLLLE